MKITLAVALVALLSSPVLAQEAVQVETEASIGAPVIAIDSYTEVVAGEVSTGSSLNNEISNIVEPVLYQEGITVEGAVEGTVDAVSGVVEGAIEPAMVTEPLSVVSGEVPQADPIYTEGASMGDGSMMTDGGTVVSGQSVVSTPSCGCGTSAAAPAMTYSSTPAPVATYSSAPIQYSAPASNPCCRQPRRGFFRALFGN